MANSPAPGPEIWEEFPTADGVQALLALSGFSYRTASEALGIEPELMLQYTRGTQPIPRYVMHALRYLALKVAAGSSPIRFEALDDHKSTTVQRRRAEDLPTAPVAPKSQLGDPSP